MNGTGTFVLYRGTDETTGLLVFTTPGIELNNAAWLVTCRFVSPLNGHTYRVSPDFGHLLADFRGVAR